MAAEKFAAEQCGRVQVAETGPGGVVVADEDHVARVRGEAVALRPAQREHGLKGRQLRRGIPRVVDALRGLAGRDAAVNLDDDDDGPVPARVLPDLIVEGIDVHREHVEAPG